MSLFNSTICKLFCRTYFVVLLIKVVGVNTVIHFAMKNVTLSFRTLKKMWFYVSGQISGGETSFEITSISLSK